MGRNFSGVEIDEHYGCVTLKRLKLAESDSSIQGYNDGVFWERNTLLEQIKKSKNQK